jgi:lysophospholipase L1-like esterase
LSNHVQPIVLFLPVIHDLTTTNPSAIFRTKQAVVQKLTVPFVDLTANLREGGESLYLEGDPTHFNASGSQIMAEALFGSVSNMAPW